MSIYRYAGDSLIGEVVFHLAKDRPPVALLSAAPAATPEQLAIMRAAIEAEGWQALPTFADGKATLQVSGFKQASEFDAFLRANQFAQGEAAVTVQPGDEVQSSHLDRVRGMSLKLAGLFNLIGTVGGILAGGINKKDPYLKAAGGLYLLSEANLIRYGNAGKERFSREAAEDLADFVRSEEGKLPEGSGLAHVVQQQKTGALAEADTFLHRHPADVTLALASGAATSVFMSGLKQAQRKEGIGKLGYGLGSIALKVISLLVPEKSKEEIARDKSRPQNFVQKVVTWIQEKPLRFYGAGSLLTDVLLPLDAYQEYKRAPGKKGWMFTAVAGAGYTLADVMYTISSKEHSNEEGGKFTADEQRRLETLAAESLAVQPEASRGAMAHRLGNFLATRKEMRGDAQSITQAILEQSRHQQDNPWAKRIAMDAAAAAEIGA